VLLKLLFDDPSQFGLATRSFYYQTRNEVIWLFHHIHANEFIQHFVERGERLNGMFPLFADMESENGSPNEHVGISLIVSSFQRSHYKELTKNGWQKMLPTWSTEEQSEYFRSPQFESEYSKEVAQRAYENNGYFGGSIGRNIEVAISRQSPVTRIEEALLAKGDLLCECYFKPFLGGWMDFMSDLLVHRNPKMVGDKYDFDSLPGVYCCASPFVLQRLLQLKNNILVTEARNKYNAGTFYDGDDGI
jgi:hypothetical protein